MIQSQIQGGKGSNYLPLPQPTLKKMLEIEIHAQEMEFFN